MYKISKKNIKFYKKNGYLVCKDIFSKQDVIYLKKYTDELRKLKPKKNKYMMYFDSKNKNSKDLYLTRTENFIPYHNNFRNFFKRKKIIQIVSQLFGSKAVLFKDKINWKQPGAKGFEPHQDSQVWENLYKNIRNFISLAISVDHSNSKNGCLEIVGEKHKVGLFGNSKSAIPNNLVKKFRWKKIYTKPGDTIFFDSYTPHRSGKNKSNKSRSLIYFTYNKLSDGNLRKRYYYEKRISFPPNNERKKGKKYKYLI